jgi:hypothetical protein
MVGDSGDLIDKRVVCEKGRFSENYRLVIMPSFSLPFP